MAPRYGIQFHPCGQIYYFTSPDAPLSLGTPVVVDTGHGENLGRIIKIVGGQLAAPAPETDEAGETEDFADFAQSSGTVEVSEKESPDDIVAAPVESGVSAGEDSEAGGENGESVENAEEPDEPGEGVSLPEAGDAAGSLDEVSRNGESDSEPDGQELSAVLSAALDPDSPNLAAIKRVAGPRDLERAEQNEAFAAKAGKYCTQCADEHRLDMKLVHTEVSLDGGKIIFFFTAPGRIDFRELVKALARNFHARIELRQIGVRHETQLVGATGNCGMVCCCRRYMRKFAPVTIKMAKEQGLFLNPVKISGTCGRLLCCLSFEQHNYEEFHGRCPKLGKKYETNKGVFKVLRASLFRNSLSLLPEMGDELEVTLEEWAAMEPARYDASRRQRAERAAERRDEGETGGGADADAQRNDARQEDAPASGGRGEERRGGRERGRSRPDAETREDGASSERGGRRREGRRDSREEGRDDRDGREGRQENRPEGRHDGRRDGRRDGRPDGRASERVDERGESGGEIRRNVRLDERPDERPDERGDERRESGGIESRQAGGESVLPPEAGASATPTARTDKVGVAREPVAAAKPDRAVKSGTGLSRFLAASAGDDDDDEK